MNQSSTRYRLSILALAILLLFSSCGPKTESGKEKKSGTKSIVEEQEEKIVPIDTLAYQQKLKALANGDTTGVWPHQLRSYPLDGAILPFKRIVAYYGNLYSKKMGVLGEYPPKEVWKKLNAEVKAWEKADSATPVQPAIHYIAIVASGTAGKDGKFRTRMPSHQIDSALAIAKMGNAIVFLDIQIAKSTLQQEVPTLEKYLKMPQVHLGIDPEFSMKDGSNPGKRIGTMDAADINYCSDYLAKLVKENNLPRSESVV